MKIEKAEIIGAQKDEGFIIICPYCKTNQTIPMEPDGMNKSFKRNCGSCTKVLKVDLPSLVKGIHFVSSIKVK